MIQAPQANYYQPQPMYAPAQPPMQQPMPQYGYAPATAPAPAAPKPQSQYNAVKIDIIEPKVNTPGSQQAQYYSYPTAPYYEYPVQSAYAPAPQVVNQQYNMPPQAVVQQPVPQQVQQPAQVAPQPEVVPPPPAEEPAASTIDVAGLTAKIKSENPEEAGAAIEQVALMAQNNPEEAVQLLDTNLMEGLLGVIAKDTASLQGPSPKQIELRQQIMSGKNLPEADIAEAKTVTPLEMAERNKQYSLFTVAILQNLLVNEFKKTNNVTPDIKDLPGMEQIVTTIKDNPNPMLRASGLAALAYNARPEYKPVMKEIFELSKKDADENVQKVAAEGLSKLEQVKEEAKAA